MRLARSPPFSLRIAHHLLPPAWVAQNATYVTRIVGGRMALGSVELIYPAKAFQPISRMCMALKICLRPTKSFASGRNVTQRLGARTLHVTSGNVISSMPGQMTKSTSGLRSSTLYYPRYNYSREFFS